MPTTLRTAASMLGGRRALYWVGNGIWLTFVMSIATVYPFASSEGSATAVGLVHRLFFALSFFAIGSLVRRRHLSVLYSLVKITVVCAAVALVGALLFVTLGQGWSLYLAALALGFGNACGFCQWLRILAPHGLRTAKYLLIGGSVVHICLMFVLNSWVPEALRPWFVFALCAPIGIALLAANVKVNSASPAEQARCENVDPARCSQALRSVLLPIVCAVALTLITPIASSVFGSAGGLVGSTVSTVAQLASLAILTLVWFVFDRDLTLPQLYCVSLPLFASAILCVSFASPDWGWVVLAIGESCFFFVSVLMVIACLAAGERFGVSALAVYGTFAGCMYLTDTARLAIENLVAQGTLNIEPYVAALLLLYVLMIPAFCIAAPLVARKAVAEKAPQEGEVAATASATATAAAQLDGAVNPAAPAPDAPDACDRVAEAYGLSKRQTEVMRYLVAGRDVDRIADALGLSPNTVRSYRKSLYAALGVHGRQELLDLVEGERG